MRRVGNSGSGSRKSREHRAHRGELLGGHRLEVLVLQDFARRERQRRVEVESRRRRAREGPARAAGASPARCGAGSSGAGGASPVAAVTPSGSSEAISFSSSCGLRQKSSNACSNTGSCSCRETSTAPSAARKSSRFGRARPPRPRRARRSLCAGPTGMPAARSTRTKCSTFSARRPLGSSGTAPASARASMPERQRHRRIPSACTSATSRAATSGAERADVVLVLEQHARGVGDRLRVERDPIERDQRLGPVERLGDAGRLEQIHRAQPLHERDDLARERLRRLRALAPDDRELALRVRIVDPVVQAAALDRVVDLARAVRRDHDDRRRCGARSGRARES